MDASWRLPFGANVRGGGVEFRVWAPAAIEVYVSGDFNRWRQDESSRLSNDGRGTWAGFIPGIGDGSNAKTAAANPKRSSAALKTAKKESDPLTGASNRTST